MLPMVNSLPPNKPHTGSLMGDFPSDIYTLSHDLRASVRSRRYPCPVQIRNDYQHIKHVHDFLNSAIRLVDLIVMGSEIPVNVQFPFH